MRDQRSQLGVQCLIGAAGSLQKLLTFFRRVLKRFVK
jgi:hypothetical protein